MGSPLQRRRPPLHRWLTGDGGRLSACRKVLAPRPSVGVRTRPSKNVTATSTAYDVLYNPWGGVGTAWPAVQGTLRVRRTCTRRDRRPCDGRTTTPHLTAGGSVGGGTKAIRAKEPDTLQLTACRQSFARR
jgi:hypothetical protein